MPFAVMTEASQQEAPPEGLKRLTAFAVLSALFVALSLCTPAREWFRVARIEQLAESMGLWGPVLIVALGTFSPLLFLPRWPIAVVCGLIYGAVWGTVLANAASTLGALLHYGLSRSLLAPFSQRWLARLRPDFREIPPDKAFLALLFLRAFPLSNFVATNILAGSLGIPFRTYLAATFLGMIPSTLMYAAWGKVLKQPTAGFYVIALLSLVFIVIGTVIAQKRFLPWLKGLGGKARPQ